MPVGNGVTPNGPKRPFACLIFPAINLPFMLRPRPHSWPQTLTDWCVIKAFERAGCPGCLRKPPGLAAAFVAEVAEVISFRTFLLRSVELMGLCQAAAESAYQTTGGDTYRHLRQAAETAESDFLSHLTPSGLCEVRRGRLEQCKFALDDFRSRLALEATIAQRCCSRAFWAAQRRQWLQKDLFYHLHHDSPIRRLAEITPVWWALFVRCLQTEFSRRDLTSFQLLGELPRLRQQARQDRKKVLSALVEDWRAAHAEELGLPARLHYHVLEPRGMDRARFVQAWFRTRCWTYPDCHTDVLTKRSLFEHLNSVSERDWAAN